MTQELWLSLPPAERARFLRHVRPWWDVHRHRLAPEIARRVELLLRLGRLTVGAGRVTAYRETPSGIEVNYRTGSGGGMRQFSASAASSIAPGRLAISTASATRWWSASCSAARRGPTRCASASMSACKAR